MKRVCLIFVVTALATGVLPSGATAQVSTDNATDLPVLGLAIERGTNEITTTAGSTPTPKVVDGEITDWTGEITRYGGTYIYSNGELVYQDHLFDAHGADDGRDAERLALMDPLRDAAPETYRLDPLAQQDAPSEVGAPTPEQLSYDDSFGDADPHQDAADIEEVRFSLADDSLYVLVRTTTMTAEKRPGVLVLVDNGGEATERAVPFNSGLTTSAADHAAYLFGNSGSISDLASETTQTLDAGSVATQPEGFTNAIEARIPLAALGGSPAHIALATGPGDATGFQQLALETDHDGEPQPNIANVAFRTNEPVQVWFERDQAMALHEGSMDDFFVELDTDRLASGVSETFHPGPGYHDRIFISDSTPQIVAESSRHGLFQHYGLYLPSSFDATPDGDAAAFPLQWWLHWRGGKAHTAGSVIPRMFKHYGEDRDTIVVSPSARGTGTWYVWRGQVDFLEVWEDVFSTLEIDRSRVYVSGHSMGGWGSYLMTILYPDRFAAAAPVAGPVTQGLWTGLDFPECDRFQFQGDTPCYISEDDGRGRIQHTRRLLDNVRHVPYAILQGTNDELVWYTGVSQQSTRLIELGYRHRLYTYPGYEHYSHPIVDQWSEAASYLHSFTNPINPARVTYKRDMQFERATEEVQAPTPAQYLDLDIDSAYWMSDLTPVDMQTGTAFFDGRSLAISDEPALAVPDGSGPAATGTTGPFIATGLQWVEDPTTSAPATSNGFDVTLTGAEAVALDLPRMEISITEDIAGTVSTETPLQLALRAPWPSAPSVTIDDQPVTATLDGNRLVIDVPAGDHTIGIAASQEVDPSPTPTDDPTASPTPTDPGPRATSLGFVDTASTGQFSDDATFTARLTDDEEAPIAGEEVTFELTSSEGTRTTTAVTDDDGMASATTTLTERPGPADLRARYGGDEDRLASTDHMLFEIAKEDSGLALDVTGNGNSRKLTATLVDADSDAGIEERTIGFTSDGETICTSAAPTDNAGTTECDPPGRHQGGPHTYEATFAEDDYYLGSGASRST